MLSLSVLLVIVITPPTPCHQYGRYWYIGMARVPHIRNTNIHGKISAKTERLAVKGCYYYYSTVSLSNKPKYMAGNHR